jgi:hypothetical protein
MPGDSDLVVDAIGDDREDITDLGSEESERYQRDHDDERHDQRVLSEALTLRRVLFVVSHVSWMLPADATEPDPSAAPTLRIGAAFER